MINSTLSDDSAINKIPLVFEKNVGQSDDVVKFLARLNKLTAFFTPKEVVLTLINYENETNDFKIKERTKGKINLDVLKITLENSNNNINILEYDSKEAKANYFIGNDSNKWHNNIPMYGQIKYKEVYDGIDIIFYGNPNKLEHDFIVNPGSDPSEIIINLQGASDSYIDENGNLIIMLESGDLKFEKPKAFQDLNGEKKEIDVSYRIMENKNISFNIGEYNKSSILIIDPILGYSTFLCTPIDDTFTIAADNDGNAYILSLTSSPDFPATPGAYCTTLNVTSSLCITKLNPDGTDLVYSTFFGPDYHYVFSF